MGDIHLTGDTMYDAYLQRLPQAKKSKILDKLDLDDEEHDVLTLHRAENVDDENAFLNVIKAISKSDHKTIFPAHPKYSKGIKELGIELDDMSLLLRGKPTMATKVGGVQEIITKQDFGILVSPRDSEELSSAILDALNRRWNSETILVQANQYSWNTLVPKIISLYRDVLSHQ